MLTKLYSKDIESPGELRHVITSTSTYETACMMLAEVEAYGIDSGDLSITARDVSFVHPSKHLTEAITASMLRSACIGGTVSFLTAVILATLGWIDPLVSLTTVGITAFALGFSVGALFGMLWRLADTSMRPFQAMNDMVAARYDVVSTDAHVADRARQLFG